MGSKVDAWVSGIALDCVPEPSGSRERPLQILRREPIISSANEGTEDYVGNRRMAFANRVQASPNVQDSFQAYQMSLGMAQIAFAVLNIRQRSYGAQCRIGNGLWTLGIDAILEQSNALSVQPLGPYAILGKGSSLLLNGNAQK